jgi:hypothetical protein
MKQTPIVTLSIIAVILGTACTTTKPSSSPANPLPSLVAGSVYHPVIDRANFTANVDNPWFPLKPGTTFIYTGMKDGEPSRDVFTITSETKVIAGVPCRVVKDSLYQSGKLAEQTSDYYTQDKAGNVWYFGEDTAELDENGKVVSTEGTWHAGVDGAQPGIYMEANPVVGHEFRQEYYKGQAEDQFKVVDLAASVTVPYGSFTNALLTEETTSLEPSVVDNKYYVRGIGQIEEVSVKGGHEKGVLVEIRTS